MDYQDIVGAPLSAQEMQIAQSLLRNAVSGVDQVDIIGDDITEVGNEVEFTVAGEDEIGRRRRMPRGQFYQNLANRRFNTVSRNGGASSLGRPVGVERAAPAEGRRGFLPLSSADVIAAGNTVGIEAKVSRPFRPDALIIDDAIAEDFLITDLKLGLTPVTVGSGPIPASMFKSESRHSKLELYTLQVNEPAVMTVQNRSTDARRFVGVLTGVYMG